MEEDKEKLKFDAFLREYSEIRQEYRTYEILQILCITLASLTFVVMFIAAVSSKQYILLFVSPLISIFFILLAMGMQMYNTILGLRASQIEGQLKNILGEPTIQWEATVGLFATFAGDILTTRVGKFWNMTSLLVIGVGSAPVLIGLGYGFKEFYDNVGHFVWLIVVIDGLAASLTIYIGFRFLFKRSWEKLKLPS
jgi:hypothetical protein